MRATPAAAVELIKRFESLHLERYICPAGYPTIGWGHVCPPDQPPIDREQAGELLRKDLGVAEVAICNALPGRWLALSDGQFGAIVSWTFNVGTGAMRSSTLIRMVKAGDLAGAAEEFPKWRRGGGRILPGLVKRRAAEREMFLGA